MKTGKYKNYIMERKYLYLLVVVVLIAYYFYTPIPDIFEEPWKLIWINTHMKTLVHLATFMEFLGLCHFIDSLVRFNPVKEVPPTSDENVTVADTEFDSIPVRVYVPRRKPSALRSAVFYVHGGGWATGSPASLPFDQMSRWMAERLDAVVVLTKYRLAPKYHFPVQFEDVYKSLRWFLRKTVLEQYGVSPERICVSGSSSGGNLAAAASQQLLDDPEIKIKPKIQALIYPALQALDLDSPSYRENAHMVMLSKALMVRLWSEYFTTDRALEKAMLSNQLVPEEYSHLFKCVNWSSLLPERFRKGHVYNTPTYGSSELFQKYPGLLDVRAMPLLADDSKLRGLPLTYVLTCQYDVLRDDGLMFVTRLRNAGVQVTHHHVEDGFHGAASHLQFKIHKRLMSQYISWLKENL